MAYGWLGQWMDVTYSHPPLVEAAYLALVLRMYMFECRLWSFSAVDPEIA